MMMLELILSWMVSTSAMNSLSWMVSTSAVNSGSDNVDTSNNVANNDAVLLSSSSDNVDASNDVANNDAALLSVFAVEDITELKKDAKIIFGFFSLFFTSTRNNCCC